MILFPSWLGISWRLKHFSSRTPQITSLQKQRASSAFSPTPLAVRRKTEKIDSDRKRKLAPISDRGEKGGGDRHRRDKKEKDRKKSKMSSRDQVRASHILIKHQGSRRKASWKDPEGRVISATTKDAAVSQLRSIREDIVSGNAKFDEVASRISDCSSAKRGGDLGPFGRGQMQKPFEEATFALKVGEISDIVDTDSGVHIIMRTG